MPGGGSEQQEKPIRFVVMPGASAQKETAAASDSLRTAQESQPMAWFVRPEGSKHSLMLYQERDSLAVILEELYGQECLDFFTGHDWSSEQAREEAEKMAARLNNPEIQKAIRTILHLRKELAETIRKSEQRIERLIKELGQQIGRDPDRCGLTEEWTLAKKED